MPAKKETTTAGAAKTAKKATKKTVAKKTPAKKTTATKTTTRKAVKKAVKDKTVKKKAVAKKAAVVKAEKSVAGGGRLKVTQVRSGIGGTFGMKRTLVALGLKHHQDEVTLPDNAAVRGMLGRVHHLVRVETVEE